MRDGILFKVLHTLTKAMIVNVESHIAVERADLMKTKTKIIELEYQTVCGVCTALRGVLVGAVTVSILWGITAWL